MASTISRGIKAPIIRQGDDIVKVVCDSVLAAMKEDNFTLNDGDVVSVTEAVVARADGNYASIDDIAADVKAKFGGETVALFSPYTAVTASPTASRVSHAVPRRWSCCFLTPPTR